jgi:membrane associated rhomboid family serine protease
MYLTFALILVTFVVSYQGLKNYSFIDKYSFNTEKVLIYKEYIRFLSSGFLHISWLHLIINMIVLYSFGQGVELRFGMVPMAIIYFISLIGGNGIALLIHRNNSNYTSIGSSGAISGLVFATIALVPGLNIFFLPAWIFGLAYVLYSIYAIGSGKTDVGHAAHLGGGLIGMAAGLAMFPRAFADNTFTILAILLPAIVLIILMTRKPGLFIINKKAREEALTIDDKYNISKFSKKEEVDRILEKINQSGIKSLSRREREILDEYSRS